MAKRHYTDIKTPYSGYFWLILATWTVIVGAAVALHFFHDQNVTIEMAKAEALANFNKDKAFRFWGAKHGGVYVPITEETPANPNLAHIPDRDIEKPDGTKLTLMNPAYMIRQMNEDFAELYGISGRITSLKPLREKNAPDEWERRALLSFEEGAEEAFEFVEEGGERYLRLMRPMMVEQDCLKCHGHQGYSVGDVRGGVGVKLPMALLLAEERAEIQNHTISLCGIWLLGIMSLAFGFVRLNQSEKKRVTLSEDLNAANQVLTATNEEIAKQVNALAFTNKDLVVAREAQAKSEEKVTLILDSIAEGVYGLNMEGNCTFCNPACLKILGYSGEDELLGKNIHQLIHHTHSDGRPYEVSACQINQSFRTGQRAHNDSGVLWRKDGTSFPAEYWSRPVLRDDVIIGAVATFVDISERKQAEEALQREHNLFLGGPAVAFLWVNAENWPVEYVSPTITQYGYSIEDWLSGKVRFAEIVHEDDLAQVSDEVSAYSQDGRISFEQRYRIYTADRQVRWVYDYTNIIRNDMGEITHYHGFILDITEQKQAEEERLSMERQMLQAQKLESLGVLAGGIAHDFNNLLMVIMGNADLALDQLSPLAPARSNIAEIEIASKRAAGLAKQMLAYSGKGKFTNEAIHLGELVEEMSHLLEVSLSKKVVPKFDFADNLPLLKGDPTQIRQVIMNLIVNASEAVGEKSGVVSIATGAIDCTREYLDSAGFLQQAGADEPLPEGIYVYLEVADTGSGMDRETLDKIFDPFFTTKFTGRGLGLAATLGIVRGHNGAIRVYSEAGKGSTFKVLLPASDTNDAMVNLGGTGLEEKWHGKGTILLVDDEETIRAVGKQMLLRRGFEVLVACDGREAVEVFREHQDEIVCVLLDLTMPHLDGNEAFREMRAICPDVKVLLCSGFNEQEATQRFTGKGLAGFIHKPFSMKDLFAKLKEALEG